MTRKLLALSLVLFASIASARTRAAASAPVRDGATVGGTIDSVNGNVIALADSLITIDASNAEIVIDRGKESTVAQLAPGMLLFAIVKTSDVAANAPLPATTITATSVADATLFGAIQNVDSNAKTFTLLGRTIHVTPETSFGGFLSRSPNPGLGELLPNQLAQVQVEAQGGRLIATSVLVIAPAQPAIEHTRGTVKSIGTDRWVVGDLTLVVNAQTKIAGSPKVGDTVEVLYSINNAHENVAVSIVKFEISIPETTIFHGTVKLIERTAWLITVSAEREVKVVINERTKIEPGIVAGNTVEVIAQRGEGDALIAIAIVKKRF